VLGGLRGLLTYPFPAILFEMEGVTADEARKAMRLAAAKLPIKTRFAVRFGQEAVS
jgi:ribosomal protein L16/L10AE